MTRFLKWTLLTGFCALPVGLFAQSPSPAATSPAAANASAPGGEHRSPEERFKRLDKNNDGFITSDETRDPDRFKRLLEKTDNSPKDGKISKDEFLKDGPQAGGHHGEPGEHGPGAGASPPGGPSEGERVSPEERFKRMDKNNDGFITQDEARDPERFKHLLERADNNPKDGKISKDEFLKAGPPPGGPHGNRGSHGGPGEKGEKGEKGEAPGD
jgi:Ca2+-binding EF-hand superfamily protein